jgi:hypothetical protein
MSASSPRRLLFLLLVVGLAFPGHASAAPWDFGKLLAKAGGFFSALWAPVGCEVNPDGRCADTSSPVPWLENRGTVGPAPTESDGPLVGNHGCEIMPDGRCAT